MGKNIIDSISFPIISILVILCFSPPVQGNSRIPSFQEFLEKFQSPPDAYRPGVLWGWNDDMTGAEIDWFMEELCRKGFREVFIFPSPGMITPYLTDSWFAAYRHALGRAEQLGMRIWIYDENSYPSGFAGGHVPAEMPESFNQGQGLVMSRSDVLPENTDGKYFIALEKKDGVFMDVTGRQAAEKNRSGEYYLFEKAYYSQSKWYGGYSYVDLLLPGVTEKFIDVTFGGYEKALGNQFGKLIAGIFTDEPHIGPPRGKNCIRWTPDLFSQFQKRWSYDLGTNLVSLIEETGDWKKVRHDYYQMLLELFIERWCKPNKEYCESRNLIWTGHYWEHTWPNPGYNGDNMAMYAWHEMPGVDVLFNEYDEKVGGHLGNARMVKELGSVVNQFGKSRAMSETYGGAGWDIRYEDFKRIADWEFVHGVNYLSQFALHTIKGGRKQDFISGMTHSEPRWQFYSGLLSYISRLSFSLSVGEEHNKILIIEPTSSAWMYYSAEKPNERFEAIGDLFHRFIARAERFQVEYDLGSEAIIADHGRIEEKKFVIGERAYDTVVLPPGLDNLNQPTASLLEEFLGNGGRIVSFDAAPEFIDGRQSDRMRTAMSRYPGRYTQSTSIDEGIASLASPSDFSIEEPLKSGGILFHQRRQFKDGTLIFLVNTSIEDSSSGVITAAGKSVWELNLLTGSVTPYATKSDADRVVVEFDVVPAGSLLLFISNVNAQPEVNPEKESTKTRLSSMGEIGVERTEPNVLVLNYCDFRVGENKETGVYFFSAADRIFKYYGFNGNPWNRSVQYNMQILEKNGFSRDSGFNADFSFYIEGPVDFASLEAVIERPDLFEVMVNGTVVESRPGEWWLDRAFGIYNIGGYVTAGENVISIVSSPFTVHSELQPVMIRGDFNLRAGMRGWKIVPAGPLEQGKWKKQGMPLYPGGVQYSKCYQIVPGGKRFSVQLNEWFGTLAEIRVNGRHAGIIGWPPYSLDITDAVRSGKNEISVIVYGSLKNLLGPFFNNPPHGFTTPELFQRGPAQEPPGSEYSVIGYGLFGDFAVYAE